MCRSIKPLYNFQPAATEDDVRAASLQFVRKISGFSRPSSANQAAFDAAVDEVTAAAMRLLDGLVTSASPRDREAQIARAKERAAIRYRAG